jgi:hypothetical protein
MANPPFSSQQRDIGSQQIASVAGTQGPFIGGHQPFAPGRNPPGLLSVDKPQFSHRMRDNRFQIMVVRSWDTDPRLSYQFIGGRQPFEGNKLPPILIDVDAPPGYVWELITLDPEDATAYFRAQPRYKVIQGAAPSVTGAFSSAGTGTAAWVGDSSQPFLSKPEFQSHIITAWQAPETITISLPQVPINPDVVPKKLLQTHIISAWEIPASIPQRRSYVPQVTATSFTGDISSAGTGTSAWIGAAQASGVVNGVGTGTAAWVGSLAQNTAPRAVIQRQIIAAWTPQQLLLQPRRFVPQIAAVAGSGALSSFGVGLANWIGAESASAAFFGAGTGTARFVGAAAAVQATRFDGWLPARLRAEERKRKDEKEIMVIAQAVLPLLQRGIRQATRIDL